MNCIAKELAIYNEINMKCRKEKHFSVAAAAAAAAALTTETSHTKIHSLNVVRSIPFQLWGSVEEQDK
uniref:Uncharacterized protein n=1 Tax=Salix viminalis TaxID=40686 RepID=A0A6N2MBW7_SALVM